MGCWCLPITGTCVADILIHSAKIGFEITMTKSELGDCCKLVFWQVAEVWCRSEGWKLEVDRSIVSALS